MTTDPQTTRYRHRTTEVEAVQWTGSNTDQLRTFCSRDFDGMDPMEPGDWVVKTDEDFLVFSPVDFATYYEPAVSAVPVVRPELRDQIAEALRESCMTEDEAVGPMTDAVLAVLPQPVGRATVLREAAEDLATAFGDPMAKHIGILGASYLRRRAREVEVAQTTEAQTEAEPETPLEKRLRYSERRNDELREECLRRGKRVLEQSEKVIALEKQLDEVRTQLGAEILRAGRAEGALDAFQRIVRRLVNHAVGFKDVLDASDHGPWERTVGADIAELIEALAEQPAVVAAVAGEEPAGEWCKCRSCWGWFVEDHPGEDLDELGKDLGWWAGLPVHRNAPAGVSQPGKEN